MENLRLEEKYLQEEKKNYEDSIVQFLSFKNPKYDSLIQDLRDKIVVIVDKLRSRLEVGW